MKRIGVLGGLTASLLLALAASHAIPAPPAPAVPSGFVPGDAPPSPPPPIGPAEKKPEPEAQTIDELIRKLASIKEQKAALDQAEKKTVALLREKLKQQKQLLEKLGVPPEESEKEPPLPGGPVPAPRP